MADLAQESFGFIGLGAMGYPMAQQLDAAIAENINIYIFDVVPNLLRKFRESSKNKSRIISCDNARQVAERSSVIITMLPEGRHVRTVFLDDPQALVQADLSNKLLIDCSTIDTQTSRDVAEALLDKSRTARFVDAPVSGGVRGAVSGQLTFMVGCKDDDPEWARIQAVLRIMGTSIFACGGQTLGLTSKLCNNYLSGTIAIASSEAMNIGIRHGLEPKRLAEIFHASTGQNCIMDKFCPVPGVVRDAPSSNGYQGGFKLHLMRKDYALAIDAAKTVDARLMLGEAGLAAFDGAMSDPNCQDRDCRIVYRYLGGREDFSSPQIQISD